jgi:CubicO group peptidase (beta-lactamase class C family)
MAAVGLVIKHSGEEITGLALKCAKPYVKPYTTPDTTSSISADERFSRMEKDIRVAVDKDGKTEKLTINEAIARHEVNGATVVIIDGGKVSTVRHYGVRSRKSNLPTNKDTLYQAASTSKFIAAIGMLIASNKEHGPKLVRSVQATADDHPNSIIAKWRDKQFKKDSPYPKDITIERLLSHTAGLDTHGIGTARTDSKTDMENILLGQVLNPGVKPFSPPGLLYSYSGGGFTAAEAMLEIHSGRSATDFLNNEVLRHFGMTKSTFNTATDSMTNLARGCSRGICSDTPEHTTVKFAGGLLANPEEYARLLTVIINNGKDSSGKELLPLADVQRLMTPAANTISSKKACSTHSNCIISEKCYGGKCIMPLPADGEWYGLGVSLSDYEDFNNFPNNLSHGGSQTDARAYFFIDRKDGRGVVIMVNGEEKWKKNGVEYGAPYLLGDIRDAFFRNFP